MLRELNQYNATSQGKVFVAVDLTMVLSDELGGDSSESLVEELRKLTEAPASAPVHVLVVTSSRATSFRSCAL